MLGPYQGQALVPGMGSPIYTAEHDLLGLIYGSPHLCVFLTHAVVDGDSTDTGNTGNTSVLRPGLVMAKVTATQQWAPFANGASDGTQWARGILTEFGLNVSFNGVATDKFLATIMVGGNVNPEGMTYAAKTGYGVDQSTAADVNIRKALYTSFRFSDDFNGLIPLTFANR